GLYNFLEFAKEVGVPTSKTWDHFQEHLSLWEEKKSLPETIQELKQLRYSLFSLQREHKELIHKLEDFQSYEKKMSTLNVEILKISKELEQYKIRVVEKDKKIDELRSRLNVLNQEKQELMKQSEKYNDLNIYIEYLLRLSMYIRTRLDFEKQITRLTPEQKQAVNTVKEDGATLIKGSAGTGKTLVLLEAFKRIKNEIRMDKKPFDSVFLTYTKTLVKYNQYLATLMNEEDLAYRLDTADSFYYKLLKTISPKYRIDINVIHELCKEFNNTIFFTTDQLYMEIERFIFANNLSREEYLDTLISRRGMRVPLSKKQREEVWSIQEKIREWQFHHQAFSRNLARILLLEQIHTLPRVEFAFVDESQDLTTVELLILKQLTTKALIMAGDTEQTIYGISSPYARAGISLLGRTRVLKTNFRNTISIFEFAEKYKNLTYSNNKAEGVCSAFREGPAPEVYLSKPDSLFKQLKGKIEIFTQYLGYDPENILILVPTKREVQEVSQFLQDHGQECINVKDDSFRFTETGKVRISTLHSGKGLDSPIVLLYLPFLPPTPEYDQATINMLNRNLIYVALTRAMDHLNIFIPEDSNEEPILDLIKINKI
ncbi:MAG: UvrD-helicase domain-containing protein, partial [Bacteroidales bacterium]